MLQIGNTLVSLDVIEKKFVCDLDKCKGMCCVHGDSGAPLEPEEEKILEDIKEIIRPYLRKEGIEAIAGQGVAMVDSDGDLVTPLIGNRECAYTYIENGIYKCAIEKAFFDGKINFRKPISCHLYPVRIKKYKDYEGVNFEFWSHCQPAIENGTQSDTTVYRFLKESLTRKYGKSWFRNLVQIAREYHEHSSNH